MKHLPSWAFAFAGLLTCEIAIARPVSYAGGWTVIEELVSILTGRRK